MGGKITRTPCSYNSPCLFTDVFDKTLMNNFQGQYKIITSGFTYDNWEKDNSENTNCEYQGLVWTCTTESVKDNFFYQWKAQTKSSFYIASDGEKAAADKFSSFMISHQMTTAGADTGACTAHSIYGAVCLLENSATDGVDTYRISATDWNTHTSGSPTDTALVTSIKGTSNALQDKTAVDGNSDPTKVEWMDYYYCSGSTGSWECAAFLPENSSDGLSQGYPRFGGNESDAGYLSYVRLTGSGNAASIQSLQILYQGAHTLAIAAGVLAMGLISF